MSIKDEFQFIQKISPKELFHTNLRVGIGDDAAVLQTEENYEQVVCMDTMIEGIHFTKQTMRPFDIGYKSLAINISDMAAMGAIPKFYLVSIAIPKSWNETEILTIYEGMDAIAQRYKMDLIGGDTVSTKNDLVISVTVIGEVEKGKAVLRSQAKPGDIVFVTGTLGDSAAGLHLLLHKCSDFPHHDYKFLISRHQRPSPRVNVGRIVSQLGRASLNDVSDGLASELNEIAEASGMTIVIHKEFIPLSQSIKNFSDDVIYNWALTGGEDFELVGTISPIHFKELKKKCEKEGVPITEIGEVHPPQSDFVIIERDGRHEVLNKNGYNHFKKGD
jgi:thiamine-monophosphate kinase